ncbi:MAG TPA: hypothetical protein VJN96_05165 [Vicinamibacterales bacterium]|nr:hypothetical protein [Vicinamibacterales bacterium]
MASFRIVSAGVMVALAVTLVAPCFALGSDDSAAMACCEKKVHGHECQDRQTAQACCRSSEAAQHDRETQPRPAASRITIASLQPSIAPVLNVPASFRLVMDPQELWVPPDNLSARSLPLLI